MTSISSLETITQDNHHALSSPSDDEDLGRRRIWEDGDELHSPKASSSKGKQKENRYIDGGNDSESDVPDSGVYPPTADDDIETRRIEEVSYT
jgi:hypothetical protein